MNSPTKLILAVASFAVMSACQTAIPSAKAEDPTTYNYTEASRSGLKTVRPYPSPDDVCQLLRVNRAVEDLVVEDRTLIACPKHEKGALADRRRAGARVVGNSTHWVILSVKDSRLEKPSF